MPDLFDIEIHRRQMSERARRARAHHLARRDSRARDARARLVRKFLARAGGSGTHRIEITRQVGARVETGWRTTACCPTTIVVGEARGWPLPLGEGPEDGYGLLTTGELVRYQSFGSMMVLEDTFATVRYVDEPLWTGQRASGGRTYLHRDVPATLFRKDQLVTALAVALEQIEEG